MIIIPILTKTDGKLFECIYIDTIYGILSNK